MLFTLMSLLLPVVLFLIIYNFYVINAVNDNLANVSTSALQLYSAQIEDSLERFNNSMVSSIAKNDAFKLLAYKDTDKTNAHLNATEMTSQFTQTINTENNISACLLISEANQIFRGIYRQDIHGYEIKDNFIQYFKLKLESGEKLGTSEWCAASINNKSYLYRCLGYNDTYCIYLTDLEDYEVPVDEKGLENVHGGAKLVFFDKTGALTQKDLVAENGITYGLNNDDEAYYFSGHPLNYMIIQTKIQGADIYAAYMIPYAGKLGNLNNSQYILMIGSLMMILLVPMGYILLKKIFFKPVDRLVEEMECIQKSQEDMVLVSDDVYPELEFRKVNHTFNNMLEQIRTLKIEAYEKELNMTRVSLQYYQIQIRPHFFLNCLKNIYGMAEEQNFDNIQKSILYLSNHLRYMLRDDARIVTFEEELQYVRNYMLLQQINAKYPPECEIDVSGDVMGLRIPAISILSFVENSVKYFAGENNKLKINIRLTLLSSEDGKIANITIHDNGKGFEPDQLKEYNFYEQYIGHNSGHIGVYNVIQRFLLYFGKENVGFAFSNQQGAQVDIFIKYGELEDEKDESVDNR